MEIAPTTVRILDSTRVEVAHARAVATESVAQIHKHGSGKKAPVQYRLQIARGKMEPEIRIGVESGITAD